MVPDLGSNRGSAAGSGPCAVPSLSHSVYKLESAHYPLKRILSSLVQDGPNGPIFGPSRAKLLTGPHTIVSIHFQTFGPLWCAAVWFTVAPHMKPFSLIGRKTQREVTPERRSAVRYRLHLPVIFHWNDGGEFTEGGFTYDVALDGALIYSTRCPPIGCDVRIEVLIPSPDQSGEQLRIQCVGKVTRAFVREGNRSCFGVRGFFDDDNIVRQIVM